MADIQQYLCSGVPWTGQVTDATSYGAKGPSSAKGPHSMNRMRTTALPALRGHSLKDACCMRKYLIKAITFAAIRQAPPEET